MRRISSARWGGPATRRPLGDRAGEAESAGFLSPRIKDFARGPILSPFTAKMRKFTHSVAGPDFSCRGSAPRGVYSPNGNRPRTKSRRRGGMGRAAGRHHDRLRRMVVLRIHPRLRAACGPLRRPPGRLPRGHAAAGRSTRAAPTRCRCSSGSGSWPAATPPPAPPPPRHPGPRRRPGGLDPRRGPAARRPPPAWPRCCSATAPGPARPSFAPSGGSGSARRWKASTPSTARSSPCGTSSSSATASARRVLGLSEAAASEAVLPALKRLKDALGDLPGGLWR